MAQLQPHYGYDYCSKSCEDTYSFSVASESQDHMSETAKRSPSQHHVHLRNPRSLACVVATEVYVDDCTVASSDEGSLTWMRQVKGCTSQGC